MVYVVHYCDLCGDPIEGEEPVFAFAQFKGPDGVMVDGPLRKCHDTCLDTTSARYRRRPDPDRAD